MKAHYLGAKVIAIYAQVVYIHIHVYLFVKYV